MSALTEKARLLIQDTSDAALSACVVMLINAVEVLEQQMSSHRHGYRWEPTHNDGEPL